ncbi:MAG: HPP family protein [Aureliella sp.]
MKLATTTGIYAHRVKDLMSKDVVAVEARDTIHEALTLMGENRVSTLPVVDNHNRCVGILSTADLVDMTRDLDSDIAMIHAADDRSLRFLLERLSQHAGEESVQSFMSESVATISPETSIAIATREMLRNQIHHLPVVNDQGKLVGIVSSIDILAEFADGAP